DKYKEYLEKLLDFLVKALRASVIVDGKIIDLHAKESPGAVPRVRRLNAMLSAEALSEASDPNATPLHFDSLREAYDHNRCDGRVLLLGEPGAGKTITLLAFARDAVVARLADPSELLPVHASITGWNARQRTPLNEWLAAQHPDLLADELQILIEQGKVMLLLDGLDELGLPLPVNLNEPGGEKFDPRDRFLQSLPLTGKIILSSRIEEYHQIGRLAQLNCAIRLERLDDDQMQEYLRDVTGLWDAVHSDSELEEALRNPLLLKLFRVGFEGDPAGTDALRALSGAQLDERIFDEFIHRRWEHEQGHNPNDLLPLTADQLKQRLGLAVMRAGSTETREDFTRILVTDVDEPDPERVVDLALRLDLLRPAGDDPVDRFEQQRRPTYRFLHLRLRDALTLPIALADLRSSIQGNESRIRAVMVLGRLGNAVAVEPLIAALSDPDTEVRIRIAIALGELKDKRAVRPLIGTLHDKDWRVKRCATNALARLGADDVLAASLSDVNADVRKGAADALVKLQIVEPLISALHDDNPDIRSTIILALERSRDPRVVPALITVLRQDSEPAVRNSAAYVLGRQDDLLALDPLIEALNDSNPDVRAMVADALGQLSDRHAVQPLVAILRDPDWYTRGRAAAALLELGAEDALIAALQDSDPRSAYAAFEVLQRLNYRPLVYQALTDFRARKLPPRRD
ncbi:MAG: HEAT repeat domain-containing protein, partial [Anaerolineae bacterium]|nr:HEAT repeat domain-containing protein [Anaerolineae bacterium]